MVTGTLRSPLERPLQALANRLNRQLRAPVLRVGWRPVLSKRAVPSGFPALDEVTGLGGFPRGRITELIGRATSGRSSVAVGAVAMVTGSGAGVIGAARSTNGVAAGAVAMVTGSGAGVIGAARSTSGVAVGAVATASGHAAWVDVSGTLDVAYLAERGVDLARLVVLRPRAPLDAFGLAGELARDGHFDIVVLDGLADLPTGSATTETMGRFLRVVVPALARAPTAMLVFSAPEHHHAALAHAAALRLVFAAGDVIRRGGVLRGWRAKVGVLKAPARQGQTAWLEIWL